MWKIARILLLNQEHFSCSATAPITQPDICDSPPATLNTSSDCQLNLVRGVGVGDLLCLMIVEYRTRNWRKIILLLCASLSGRRPDKTIPTYTVFGRDYFLSITVPFVIARKQITFNEMATYICDADWIQPVDVGALTRQRFGKLCEWHECWQFN